MEIAGAVAVVTGAAACAGREIALRLAREAAVVVVADVDAARGEAVVREVVLRPGEPPRLLDPAPPA